MSEFTFYELRDKSSDWITVPGIPDTLLWGVEAPLFLESIEQANAFHIADWEDAGAGDKHNIALHALYGQLSDVRLMGTEDNFHIWTAKKDRKRVERLPVILAFQIPDEHTNFIKQHGMMRTPQALPPAQFGELALIASSKDASISWAWVRCSITKLDQQSQNLHRRLSAALAHLNTVPHSLQESAWLVQWKGIQNMAQQLAQAYWDTWEAAQQGQRPHVPNVFKDNMAWTGLNMGLWGTQSAIQDKDHWTQEVGMLPHHTRSFENGYTMVWLQQPGENNVNADLASEELTKHLAAMSDLEADIVAIQIAQAMAAQNDQGEAILTPEAILEYRGIKPMKDAEGYRAGHRAEDREDVIKAFGRTAWLRLKILQGIKHKGRPIEVESAYVLIKEWVYQPTFDDSPRRLLAWRYQMGTWLAPFMDEAEAGRYFGVLMKRTLEYNLKNELVEKRLARYFTVHLCIAAKNGAASIKRYVGNLIDECTLSVDQRNPQRTKDRFEKALQQLVTDGIIGDWAYTDDSPLPARQWLDTWRTRSVRITLGPQALQAYQPMLEKAQARRAALAAAPQTKRPGKQSKRQPV